MKLAGIAVGGGLLSMGVVAACTTQDEEASFPDASIVLSDAGTPDVPLLETSTECQNTCSPDGRNVLCDGGTVETCSADKSCVNGKCMTACEEAEATHGYVGCDYYVPPPDSMTLGYNACFAAFVVNDGSTPVTIQVDRNGVDYEPLDFAYTLSGSGLTTTYQPLVGGVLAPGKGAVLFLSSGKLEDYPVAICPDGTKAATADDPAVHGVGFGEAFHIKTSAPVATYDIYPYGGGQALLASATLLLPTSTWDTNYVAVAPYESVVLLGGTRGVPWLELVAKEDDTEIRLTPTADIVASGPGLKSVAKGALGTFTLNKGQILQFEQDASLAGTPILANKPIGVWAGHTGLLVPGTIQYADGAHQQIPPVRALGNEYIAVSHRDRYDDKPETTPWRLTGAVNGTTLTYAPAAPKDAPTTLSSGQVVEFWSTEPFTVKSQDENHPFYMAGYMTSCEMYAPFDENGYSYDCRGDPEFVNVVAAKQYLESYTFLTDPTYSETNLIVVRTRGDQGFADVTLDCAGVIGGWKAVGDYEWTRLDLVRHNFEPQAGCDNGFHKMTSTQPFGLTVWGWGTQESDPIQTTSVSYAYPAGMYVKPLTDVVVEPIPK